MKDKGKNSEFETVLRWLRSLFVPSLGLTLRASACRNADDLGDAANQQNSREYFSRRSLREPLLIDFLISAVGFDLIQRFIQLRQKRGIFWANSDT